MDTFIENLKFNLLEQNRYQYLLQGLKTTLIVTIFALLIGLILGAIIAILKSADQDLDLSWTKLKDFPIKLLAKISSVFVTIIRGTPTTIQLLIMFNIILIAIDNLILVAILTFGINSAAYMSELFRGAILSVNKGEKEAARSLGLSYMQMNKKIVLPQAFKYSMPALSNEVITLFKETSISGFIGLTDLTRGSSIITTQTFQATIPYMSAALIYLIFVLLIEKIFKLLERKNAYVTSK